MDKKKLKKLTIIIWGIAGAIFLVNIILGFTLQQITSQKTVISPTPVVTKVIEESISYKGEEGTDALTLLEKNYSIEQDASGLVVGINNKKADSKKREFWAFYVNNKMAEVGPADYQTKKEDVILWKIETY